MHLHFEPVMYVFRGYAQAGGFDRHAPYDLVGSVFCLGDGRARIFATQGDLDATTIRQLAEGLKERGIHTVLINRHGVEQTWINDNGRIRALKS
jgi:hypothetical protein